MGVYCNKNCSKTDGPRRALGFAQRAIQTDKEETTMPTPRKLPDTTTLVRLRRNGWTLDRIAEEYGATRTGVWKALERAGKTNPMPTYRDVIPWRISPEHQDTGIMVRIRALVRQRQGVPLPEGEERRLKEWLQGMNEMGVVLNYHPEAPANAASTKGGFYYVPREPGDEWIFRKPVQ